MPHLPTLRTSCNYGKNWITCNIRQDRIIIIYLEIERITDKGIVEVNKRAMYYNQ